MQKLFLTTLIFAALLPKFGFGESRGSLTVIGSDTKTMALPVELAEADSFQIKIHPNPKKSSTPPSPTPSPIVAMSSPPIPLALVSQPTLSPMPMPMPAPVPAPVSAPVPAPVPAPAPAPSPAPSPSPSTAPSPSPSAVAPLNYDETILLIKKLYSSHKFARALELLLQIEDQKPNSFTLQNMKGSLGYALGKLEIAKSAWERSLAINPKQPKLKARISELLKEGF